MGNDSARANGANVINATYWRSRSLFGGSTTLPVAPRPFRMVRLNLGPEAGRAASPAVREVGGAFAE